MFWVTTILLIAYIIAYIVTYIIDPTENMYTKKQDIDETSIREISEQYVNSLGIKIKKPIRYRFVQYKPYDEPSGTVVLGTFHEWNGVYYIDISVSLYKMTMLDEIVIHETRHLIVQELKNEKIIDLIKYTEEIAQGKSDVYNNLFINSVKLLKEEQKDDKI